LKAAALSITEKMNHKQVCEDFIIAIQIQEVLDEEEKSAIFSPPSVPEEWKYAPPEEYSSQLQIAKEDIISLYQLGENVSDLINIYLGEHPEEADEFGTLLSDAVSSYSIMFNVKTYTPKKPDSPEDIFEIDYLASYDSEDQDGLSDDDLIDECTNITYADERISFSE